MTDHIIKIEPLDWFHDEVTNLHIAEGAFATYQVRGIDPSVIGSDAYGAAMEVLPKTERLKYNKISGYVDANEAKRAAYMHHVNCVKNELLYGDVNKDE